jgi:hypothetical protein
MSDQAQAVAAPSVDDRISAALFGEIEPEQQTEAVQTAEPEQPQAAEPEQPQSEESAPVEQEAAPEEPEAPPEWEAVKALKLKVPLKNGAEEREAEVTIDELRLGYMRNDDYTRKTKEAAEVKRLAQEEAMQGVAKFQEQAVKELKTMEAWITQVAAPEMQGVNWNTLAKEDPAEFVRLSHRANQLAALKQQIGQKLQQAEQQRTQEEDAKRAQAIEQAQSQLASDIPNWNAELQQALVKSGRNYGFSDDELAKVYDPKFVKVLHDAHQWQLLQKQKPIAEKKVVEVPKVLRSGANPTKADAQRGAYEALRARIKKSGGKGPDGHAAVEELIRSRLGA